MLAFTIKPTVEDLLAYYLQAAATRKSTRRAIILFGVIGLASALVLFYRLNISSELDVTLLTPLGFMLVSGYCLGTYKLRTKARLRKYILKQNQTLGIETHMEFNDNGMVARNNLGSSEMKLESIKRVTETPDHFILELLTGVAFVIP